MNRSLVNVIDCGRFLTLLILAAGAIGMVLSSQMERYESVPRFLDLAYVLAYFLSLIGTGFWVLTCLGIYNSVKAFRSAGLNVSWLWVTVSILGTPVFAMFTVWIFVVKQKHLLDHLRHSFPAVQTIDKSDKMRC